jgi:uncharacterized protein (TIGR03437 family)
MHRIPLVFALSAAAALAQTPTVTAVVNAASFSTQLCPGLLATIYGSNFGTDSSKATVTVGGKNAYVFSTGFIATQLTVQLPMEVAPGSTTITVAINGSSSSPFNITLGTASPALLTQNSAGTGLAVIFNSGLTAELSFSAPAHPGDTVVAYGVGLGVTSPATPTGVVAAGVVNTVVPAPTVTIGGQPATAVSASLSAANPPGAYQINLKLPTNVQGTQPIVITAGGQSSSSTDTIPITGTSSLANNASFANPGTIAPGSIASLFANGLGSASTNQVTGLFPSTQSEGVSVTFNGEAAPLFHLVPTASPQQIDLYVPNDLPTSGTVNVQLATSSALYANYTLKMVPASPGFYRFTDPKTSNQYVIAQFANSAWLVLPSSTTANLGLPVCASTTGATTQCGEPATIGDYLVLYLTGLGLATPNGDPSGKPLVTGTNPPADGSVLYESPTLPTVTIGGIAAKVLFSGLAPGYAGEYQVDVQVPAGVTNGDSVPIIVTMLGASDTTNISIQPGRVPPPNQ